MRTDEVHADQGMSVRASIALRASLISRAIDYIYHDIADGY